MRPPARDAPWTEAQGRGMAQDQLGVRTRDPGRVSPLVRSQAGPDCVTPAARGVADFNSPSPERRVPPDLGNRAIREPSPERGRPLGCPSHDVTQDWGRRWLFRVSRGLELTQLQVLSLRKKVYDYSNRLGWH